LDQTIINLIFLNPNNFEQFCKNFTKWNIFYWTCIPLWSRYSSSISWLSKYASVIHVTITISTVKRKVNVRVRVWISVGINVARIKSCSINLTHVAHHMIIHVQSHVQKILRYQDVIAFKDVSWTGMELLYPLHLNRHYKNFSTKYNTNHFHTTNNFVNNK